MNKAESAQIAGQLEMLGYNATPTIRHADMIVLNTCMVRQSAEDKVLGIIGYLKGIKRTNSELRILVTGCLVDSKIEDLIRCFPHVDMFFKPGEYDEINKWAEKQNMRLLSTKTEPSSTNNIAPCAFVPIIQGCNNFCSYCIVPYRRGREKSRPLAEIVDEVNMLSKQGVREVTLLGQNVNSYGHDIPSKPNLGDLLTVIHSVEGICRIRFLTNHPKDMSQELIEDIASLDKVCKHINLPFQAGDNQILHTMRRGYTIEQYRDLVDMIRNTIPDVALSTDVIVGFPHETEKQFIQSLTVIEDVRFDKVHAATYSPRPGTIAAKKYDDDVPSQIKEKRLSKIEATQTKILSEINYRLLGKTIEILVEGKNKEKWYGRTKSDKLVFFEDKENWTGKLVNIEIRQTSPWSLQGNLVNCEDFAQFRGKNGRLSLIV